MSLLYTWDCWHRSSGGPVVAEPGLASASCPSPVVVTLPRASLLCVFPEGQTYRKDAEMLDLAFRQRVLNRIVGQCIEFGDFRNI